MPTMHTRSALPSSPTPAPGQVLVVEEDRDVRELVGIALRRGGFTPILVGNESAASKALASARPDAMVVGLPVGRHRPVELLRRWRRHAHVPIVLLSPDQPAGGARDPSSQRALTHLPKPFSPRALADCVRSQMPTPRSA
jgi:DNA-binding NtrC family response regulator